MDIERPPAPLAGAIYLDFLTGSEEELKRAITQLEECVRSGLDRCHIKMDGRGRFIFSMRAAPR